MFYKKQDVDSALICSFCSEILRDPRILPCGTSACHECIQSRSNAENELECTFCKRKHVSMDSESGFCPNLALQKLIESKAANITIDHQKVETLESKLAEIGKKGEDFKAN
jgi:hypothetical protein